MRGTMIRMTLLTLLLAGGLVACATSPDEDQMSGLPDWVLNTPDDMRYAYGVGSSPVRGDQANARRIAADRARSDLIQGLRVTVSGETRTWIERVREDGAGPVTRGFAEEVRTRLPETTLDEMEIHDVVVDESSQVLYALARLDRSAATMRLSNELNRIRQRLDKVHDSAPASGETGRLDRIRHYQPALEDFARAERLEDQLRLVSRQPITADPIASSHSHVLDASREALDALRIRIDDENTDERIASAIRSGLLDRGLRVGGDDTADLVVSAELTLRTVSREPDYFAFAEGNVVVSDADGRAMGQFRHRSREGSTDPGLAEDRVLEALGEQLGRTLGKHLMEFF